MGPKNSVRTKFLLTNDLLAALSQPLRGWILWAPHSRGGKKVHGQIPFKPLTFGRTTRKRAFTGRSSSKKQLKNRVSIRNGPFGGTVAAASRLKMFGASWLRKGISLRTDFPVAIDL